MGTVTHIDEARTSRASAPKKARQARVWPFVIDPPFWFFFLCLDGPYIGKVGTIIREERSLLTGIYWYTLEFEIDGRRVISHYFPWELEFLLA